MPGSPRMTQATEAVLGALLDDPAAPWYGLELAEHAGRPTGTIYPLLARLERMGWLESAWERGDPSVLGRPKRRLYRLTGVGQQAAAAALDAERRRRARGVLRRPVAPQWPQGSPA
jgi:PadR family transcriptional regulator PadR